MTRETFDVGRWAMFAVGAWLTACAAESGVTHRGADTSTGNPATSDVMGHTSAQSTTTQASLAPSTTGGVMISSPTAGQSSGSGSSRERPSGSSSSTDMGGSSAVGASSSGVDSTPGATNSGGSGSNAGGTSEGESTTSSPSGAGSPGCGAASPLESGTFDIDVDGTSRSYTLDVPADYDPQTPYRLVFVWHPLGGSAAQVVRGDYDGLKPLSDGTAILVAPDGLEGMAAGITGQGWYNTDGSDMVFLRAMLDHFNANLCVDQGKIFSTGFSFGGMMSYAIGCEMADVFRAIAPSSGNSAASGCNQATEHAVAVLGLHGDMDDFVATDGGRTARDIFVARNHCTEQTQPYEPSPCVEYQGCDAGYPVIWCEYPGEHRPWSSAPEVIWSFFSAF